MMGGSHGGFLTGNLVGQYPDRFKCAVLRNPVMDISLMIHVSDIPDWTYVEAFGSQVGAADVLFGCIQVRLLAQESPCRCSSGCTIMDMCLILLQEAVTYFKLVVVCSAV